MDSTHFNLRIFDWHVQILRGRFGVFVSRNTYHRTHGWPNGYVSLYNFFGYRP